MSEIITVGLDLAKIVFQAHGADAAGHRRWPNEVKAQAVGETLSPSAAVNDVAVRFRVQPIQFSLSGGWQRAACRFWLRT